MKKMAFVNADVFPVVGERYRGGVVVENGRILYMGSDESVRNMLSEDDDVLDLEGKTLLPGLIDSHIHPFGLIMQTLNLDLTEVRSISELIEVVGDRVNKLEPGEWLIGRGWDDTLFIDEKRFPDRIEIDKVAPNNPVILVRTCGHVGIANTEALRLLSNMLDKDDSNLEFQKGLLKENLLEKVMDAVPLPPYSRLVDAAEHVFRDMFKLGLTTVVDMGGKEANLRVYQKLAMRKHFPFKVRLYMMPEYLDAMVSLGVEHRFGSSEVKIMGLKVLMDGSLGAHTAYLIEPYADDEDNVGILNYSREELLRMVEKATRSGLQVAVHVIGDGAALEAVSVFGMVEGIQYLRPRLEHCQVLSKEIVEKMAQFDVIASVQPVFVFYDAPWVVDRIGSSRLDYAYAWKKLKDAGVVVSGGSDAPVCLHDPLKGIQSAITRVDRDGKVFIPQERLSLLEAVKMFTIDAAYSVFEDSDIGSLEVGKKADMVVLSGRLEENNLDKLRVVLTMVDGEVVFSSS